ncbi:2-succinyl-6-hydroxy-2,4-cyclohexadiene-1-carboxylate synthase [Roseobacter fucihabitans]|uniref:2-succinyl-6-hydroxy-2, 4-cyclohexadiene-1-carboxylate synthase n=1 Tax=Roseobacter fucihabitans TaxID=1537242 RepID=A0ABZ2BTB7_9RHOB|nr:alpha/beta hydrolase [Roseobacter litoralis]MBC6968001.1 Dihydrolipoyllysine-residue acetyltransferase component of acetoin cleaving system [Roseobacter litoralis]
MVIIALLATLGLIALVQWRAGAREAQAERAYPPVGQIVEVDGTKVHLHVQGTGPDVVLIHGASGSLRDYTFDLVDRLKDRYRVISLDRPGLGWTTRPEPDFGGAWSIAAEPPALQARLLQAAADTVGVTRPIVVGHSFGGAVALAWALERPEDTAALVLLAAASMPWEGELGALYQVNSSLPGSLFVVPLITAFTPDSRIETTVKSIFAPQPMPDGYLDHIGPDMSLRRATLRANAQQVNNLRPHIIEMSKQYPDLLMPVELLHGTADTTVGLRIHSEPLAELLPNATLTRLEGVGHMPHHAAPEQVVAAIERATTRAGLR